MARRITDPDEAGVLGAVVLLVLVALVLAAVVVLAAARAAGLELETGLELDHPAGLEAELEVITTDEAGVLAAELEVRAP